MTVSCDMTMAAYTCSVNELSKNSGCEGDSTGDLFAVPIQRREFLGTGASLFARIDPVVGNVTKTLTTTEKILAVRNEPIIPVFKSISAQLHMKHMFGEAGTAAIGKPLAECMPKLLRFKAQEILPDYLLREVTEVENDVWIAFANVKSSGNAKGEIASFIRDHMHIPASDVEAWTDEQYVLLEKDPIVQARTEGGIGVSIAYEIFDAVNERIGSLIARIAHRKMLQYFHDPSMQEHAQIRRRDGVDAVASALGTEDHQSLVNVMHRYCSSESIQTAIDTLCNPEEFAHHRFLQLLDRRLDVRLASICRIKKHTKIIRQTEEIQQEEKSIESIPQSYPNDPDSYVGEIMRDIQSPLQRLLVQIQLLANPAYERQWENGVS